MRLNLVLSGIVSLVFLSCQGIHLAGTYPGVEDPLREVSLRELARYYHERTNGLITYSFLYSEDFENTMTFVWDPYFKMRVFPASSLGNDVAQDLFEFNAERFVHESGAKDFVSATYQFYGGLSFDDRKQTHERPYRYLSSWGNLFYPPIKTLKHPLSFYHAEFSSDLDPLSVSSVYFDPEFQKRLDEETQTALTYGNTLRPLFNGVESYPEKLRLTLDAKKLLYVAVMSFIADETGRELVRSMVHAKRSGVDVRLITEGFYTFSISNYCIGVLEREGIPVVRVDDKTLKRLDRMFHNKIWVRDGEEAIIGGMNILNYENNGNGFNFLNRDTDILVRGPAATDLLASFITLWKKYDTEGRSIEPGETILARRMAEENASGVRGPENYSRWLENPETRMNGICRVAVQGNNAQPQNIATLILRYLEAARHSLYITSPEIEFDLERNEPERIDRLARLMADKCRIPDFYMAYITNGADGGLGESSSFLRSRVKDSQLVGERFWEDMLTPMVDKEGRQVNHRVRKAIMPLIEAGLHGYQYFNYVHAKEFYFDRLLVGIGSWNFDGYSADKNHESMIFCLDSNLRLEMERQMVLDMINSVPIVRPGQTQQANVQH